MVDTNTADTDTRVLPSACPLDCPDACSLDVTLEGDRVVKIDGSQRNPITAGFICNKVRHYAAHLYGEARMRTPGVRRGARGSGFFEPISWDAAFDLIAERITAAVKRHGGEAVLPLSYGGSNGYLTQGTTDDRFFHRLGASRLARTVCAAVTGRVADAMYGRMLGVAPEDFVEAQLIVVWGANPSVSGIHLVPIIQEAQRRGAKLVVVDPRRTPLAKQADLHLALEPGTDTPLALAVHRWLFEVEGADQDFLAAHTSGAEALRQRAAPWTPERAAATAGLKAADVEAFARLYAASKPAVVRCGWGPERNRNGGSAIAAILALPAVGGKFGCRGGGYMLSNFGTWRLDTSGLGAPEPDTRIINMNRLGEVLLHEQSPPVEVLFVYNANPLATLPEQEKVRAGLSRSDLFTVVFDAVMTDTARYADVVLPATTFFEHRELIEGYGAMVLNDIKPLIPPVGEARPNYDVFATLCRRLGLDRPGEPETAEAMRAALDTAHGEEVTLTRPGGGPIQMQDVMPRTPDGKIHLLPAALEAEAAAGLYTYRELAENGFPLALVSPSSKRTISSTLGELYRKQVAVELHPDDAAARGIESGEEVRVFNHSGEVFCKARLSQDLRPGVVFLPKGLWQHNTLNGATSNALVPDTLADIAGGACFNDARVEIERT